MDQELISVSDVAQELGTRKQQVFKVLKKIGITPTKQRDATRRNQLASYVTRAEVERLKREHPWRARGSGTRDTDVENGGESVYSMEVGVFYVVQLEPKHDPGRFKVGFAANMDERLRKHRCSAPFAVVLKTWRCRRVWERAAIDCVTVDCDQLYTEVFRTDSVEDVVRRAEAFFDVMPEVCEPTREAGTDKNRG